MDKYTATEQAYKHGYEKGYEAGRPKWIPVTERLPESVNEFIVMIKGAEMPTTLWYDCWSGCWYQPEIEGGDGRKYEVTHWMLLPELPKEGE